ncbi:ATP-binding cassette domain-containing protein [Microbacterium paludicola]|uniref:ATP-binding cassette domain-containing protein n=1 Tax=Microbacterium paludicola TaxID=300019 RepID=UPI001F38D6D3|nr:ABC transporter ATP-binding protein [Microbacterium paludicola]
MTTSPLDDDAGTTSSGGAAPAPGEAVQRPGSAGSPAKRPAIRRPAKRPTAKTAAERDTGESSTTPSAAAPRKPAAKRPVQGGKPKPRSGTKTSAARNAAGRSAVAQPPAEADAPSDQDVPTSVVPVVDVVERPADPVTEPDAPAAAPETAAAETTTTEEAPVEVEDATVAVAEIGAPETPAVQPETPAENEPETQAENEPETQAENEPETPAENEPEAPAEDAPEAPADAAPEAPVQVESKVPAEVEPEAPAAEPETAVLPATGPATDPAAAPAAEARPEVPPALVLRGVSRSYGGTTAVAGIDLTVPAGSFYGLVGPNGAGKTTTMSMIAGLLRPDRGEISVAGVDLAKDPRAAKALMGVLPDRLRTFDRLTGRQLLYYFGVLRGLKPDVVESRTADLARAFDLTDALGRVVSDYSAGMTKKIMLAAAMIHSPRLLVLDEPFEAVDPVSSANILEILSTYVSRGGTVLLSSHGMDLIERVCTRVAVIVAGQLLAEGTVEEVRGELTLEQRFVELSGEVSSMEGLEWLHTFSD